MGEGARSRPVRGGGSPHAERSARGRRPTTAHRGARYQRRDGKLRGIPRSEGVLAPSEGLVRTDLGRPGELVIDGGVTAR